MAIISRPDTKEEYEIPLRLDGLGKHRVEAEVGGLRVILDIDYQLADKLGLYREKEWLVENYVVKGLTMAELARTCGVSPMTIHLWLKKHEIPSRPRGRRG